MGVTVVVSGGNLNVTLGLTDATVENSDETYSATVSGGNTLTLPDITVTKLDDTTFSYPAAKNLDIGDYETPTASPSTWDEFVSEYGRGYEYPIPSNQGASYRTADDKDIEDTIFGATNRNAQTLKARNTLASFLVLNNNNAFGNTNRFTDDAGGQSYANDLVIDHYTGLMWYRVLFGQASWNTTIDAAAGSSQGGYSDWFIPNIQQQYSILNMNITQWYNYAPFNITLGLLWTSTTTPEDSNDAIALRTDRSDTLAGVHDSGTKTATYRSIMCRKHY